MDLAAPKDVKPSPTPAAPMPLALHLLLWGGVLLIYFRGLAGGSLAAWDEALTGERAREFFLHPPHWLTVYYQDAPDFNKPPLYYWFTALCFKLLGEGEGAVRLGSALAGICCLGLIYRIGRATAGWGAGALGVLFLATNAHWINKTREGLLDSAMLLGMLGGIHLLLQAPHSRRRLLGAGLLPGLGCLAKCPVALLAYAAPALELLRARRKQGAGRRLLAALGICLAVALPWFLYETWRWGPRFIDYHFGFNMIQRLAVGIARRQLPATVYLRTWLTSAPVFFLFFCLAPFLAYDRAAGSLRPWSAYLGQALLLLGLIHLSASWRIVYALYVYPFAAVAAGAAGALLLERLGGARRRRAAAGLLAALSLGAFLPQYIATPDYSGDQKEAALRIRRDSRPEDLVLTVDLPVNIVLFYSHRTVRSVTTDGLEKELRKSAPGRPVYLVGEGKTGLALKQRAAGLTGNRDGVAALTRQGRITVVKVNGN